MWPNPRKAEDLVTFTEQILNGKFLCIEAPAIDMWKVLLFWCSDVWLFLHNLLLFLNPLSSVPTDEISFHCYLAYFTVGTFFLSFLSQFTSPTSLISYFRIKLFDIFWYYLRTGIRMIAFLKLICGNWQYLILFCLCWW